MTETCRAENVVSSSFPRRYRIVVIESRLEQARVLGHLLEFDDHDVRYALNGTDGAQLAISWRPDIVMSSVALFGIDGFEVAREIRRHLSTEPLLIATTSYAKHEIGERLKEAGFDLFLAKPISRDMLLEALRVREGAAPSEEIKL